MTGFYRWYAWLLTWFQTFQVVLYYPHQLRSCKEVIFTVFFKWFLNHLFDLCWSHWILYQFIFYLFRPFSRSVERTPVLLVILTENPKGSTRNLTTGNRWTGRSFLISPTQIFSLRHFILWQTFFLFVPISINILILPSFLKRLRTTHRSFNINLKGQKHHIILNKWVILLRKQLLYLPKWWPVFRLYRQHLLNERIEFLWVSLTKNIKVIR